MRRYRPMRTGTSVSGQVAMFLVACGALLGLLTLTVGTGLVAGLIGGLSSAFGDAVSHITSQAPATPPPSGVTLDTPVLAVPPDNGYTNQPTVVIQGTVPGATVGQTGYSIHVYLLVKNGTGRQVASVPVGGTTHFSTSPIALTEGSNAFVATVAGPTGEGQPSPVATYILDTTPPKIKVTSPASGAKLTTSTVTVSGTVDPGVSITIRNEQVVGGAITNQTVGSDGTFKLAVPIVAGPNTIDLMATDQAGNSASTSLTVNRDYGQLAAHLAVSPSKFAASAQTTLRLTLHATSLNGGPLANAKATFTVTIQGLGPIVSPELTTDSTGTATWQVSIAGAAPGTGQASVLVTSPAGDQITGTAAVTTT
jgi:hypothetical protein